MLDKANQAARLGLTERELTALLDVRDDLESGKIPEERFSMTAYCGTKCCIGGHMAIRLGISVSRLPTGRIDWLFLPTTSAAFLYSTPAQAVAAIDRWIASDGTKAW